MSVETKQKVRYNYEFLKKYCEENNIVLLKDYSNEKVTRDTRIEAKCISENCDEDINKSFRRIIEKSGCYCIVCSVKNGNIKIKKTNIAKYGVEYTFQNQNIQNKIKETNMKNHGVEYPQQSKLIRKKTKQTYINNWSVEHISQSQNIKNKKIETCLKNHGVEHPLQSKLIREKIKKTNIAKYGVENTFQSEKIKEKIIKTNIEKYGVEYTAQNTEIMDKCSKNAYKLKDYILPSGNIIKVQGYEHYAYDELLNIENINEEDIINGVSNVPEIWYKTEDKERRHYVDIYIPSQNRCIEVKSTWTAEKKQDNIFLKQEAGKELGYNYEIWVYNGKGEKVECYK